MISKYTCDDCGTEYMEQFSLDHALWGQIAGKREILCLPCTEKRLGRKVTLKDLNPCMMTFSMYLGAYIAKNTPPEQMPPDNVLLDPESFAEGRRWIETEQKKGDK